MADLPQTCLPVPPPAQIDLSARLPVAPAAALDRLQAIYALLEAELEPLRRACSGRAICCDFAQNGQMLYVTTLEAAELARAGAPANARQASDGICPFLRGRICAVRPQRALGCRIYYCDRTYEEERNALYEKYVKLVRLVQAEYGLPENYRSVTQIGFQE